MVSKYEQTPTDFPPPGGGRVGEGGGVRHSPLGRSHA